ncbi:type II toxin-antitoxin system HicB family antitoxin [Deinococcus planocerae]|uniref:type II toxin-antitoxin system HicB family antitoxin n=1 Tax=Deinococcus planocerae TaxID=1737569 RepID=UPI000C7EB0A8|nr:hypothetical protein [Deinococcus planocerae]
MAQTYLCVVEQGDEGSSWGAYALDLPVSATGASRDKVVRLLRERLALHIDWLRADGEEVPPPTTTEAQHRAELEADEAPEISDLSRTEFLLLEPVSFHAAVMVLERLRWKAGLSQRQVAERLLNPFKLDQDRARLRAVAAALGQEPGSEPVDRPA